MELTQVLRSATAPRGRARAGAAVLVILAHVGIVYLLLLPTTAFDPMLGPRESEPVVAAIIDAPPPRPLPPLLTTPIPKRLKLHVSLPQPTIDFDIEPPANRVTVSRPQVTTSPGSPEQPGGNSIADAALSTPSRGPQEAASSAGQTQTVGSDEPHGAISAAGTATATGSPAPQGPFNSAGNASSLMVTHYVAPMYPAAALRDSERGLVTLTLQVDERGLVSRISVLASSGSRVLDEAAVHAVRQWRFRPAMNGTHPQRVSTSEQVQFGPSLVGVPFTGQLYDMTIDQQVSAAIRARQDHPERAPVAETSLRSLIDRLLARFSHADEPVSSNRHSAPSSLEEVLAMRGRLESIRFLGFDERGLDRDTGGTLSVRGAGHLGSRLPVRSNWEIYQVEQHSGTALWLVKVNGNGAIQRVDVAIRE